MAKQTKGGNAQRRTRQQPQQNFQQAPQQNFQQPQGQTYNANNPYPAQGFQQNPQYAHNGNGSNQPQGNFVNQSPEYDNELHGAMFKNQRKFAPGGNPAWPDYTGNCQIGGIEYWVSGWAKTSKNGQPYLSLSYTPKYPEQGMQEGGFTNDLPF